MLQDSISNPLPNVEGTWFVKNRDGWKELEAPAATHPITPPEELVRAWASLVEPHGIADVFASIAQWGSDQELEACAAFVKFHEGESLARDLRKTRRPKPLSLKEQALAVLDDAELDSAHYNILLRALEQLPDPS